MAGKDEIPRTDPAEVEALIARLGDSNLPEHDRRRIAGLLRLLLRLASILEQKKVYLGRLRRLIFGPGSEKRNPPSAGDGAAPGQDAADAAATNTAAAASAAAPPPAADKAEQRETTDQTAEATQAATAQTKKAPRGKNKGRIPAASYTGADVVFCPLSEYQPGDPCPDPDCRGHLRRNGEEAVFLRMTGHPPLTATRYDRETLRCSDCGNRKVAPLPADVPSDKWDPTADAAIVITKYHLLTPCHRTAALQAACGVPLPASTQWERIEEVAKHLQPVFRLLWREGANGEVIYADDTRFRIQALLAENKLLPPKSRTGMQTTGMVIECGGHRIVLYATGRNHAGENVDALLTRRQLLETLPVYMADALAASGKVSAKVEAANCLAHARRPFVDLRKYWPEEVARVLDAIGEVYKFDAETKGMEPAARLAYHQEHSRPVMEGLRSWIDAQFSERRVEPNGPLAKAYGYLRNHWEKLTRFLSVANCPLDNNLAERMLRRIALLRKNTLFYKTAHGAQVADIILSVLNSCVENDVNVWEYLVDLLRRPRDVWRNPRDWLPWNYGRGAPAAAASSS